MEIVKFVRERTQRKGLDKNNKKFPAYTPGYKKSLDFKIAGKTSKVNLTLSGDMMDLLGDHIKERPGEIEIGYERGDDSTNGKVEGNITGSYGQPKGNRSKARDYMGIARSDLRKILAKFPLDDKRKREENIAKAEAKARAAEEV